MKFFISLCVLVSLCTLSAYSVSKKSLHLFIEVENITTMDKYSTVVQTLRSMSSVHGAIINTMHQGKLFIQITLSNTYAALRQEINAAKNMAIINESYVNASNNIKTIKIKLIDKNLPAN